MKSRAYDELLWEAWAAAGSPTASLVLRAPAIPLGYRAALVTEIQSIDVRTGTNVCPADGTRRVVDFGRPALDGRVALV